MLTACAAKNPGCKHTRLPTHEAMRPCLQTDLYPLCNPTTISWNAAEYTHQNNPNALSLSLPAFVTLSEARVEGPGPVQIQAVPDWLQAQVDDLVEAELAAVNGCCFWLQGDKDLLGTFRWNQTGLGKGEREGSKRW